MNVFKIDYSMYSKFTAYYRRAGNFLLLSLTNKTLTEIMHTFFPNFWLNWPYISHQTISSVILTKSGTGATGSLLVFIEAF